MLIKCNRSQTVSRQVVREKEMKKFFLGIVMLFAVCVAITANAEDEMVARAKSDAEIKRMAAEMNAACGASIGVSIDWDSFANSGDWQEYSIPSFCGAPLEALMDFCGAEKGNSKAYIQKKVGSVTCYYGGEGRRAIQVDDGAIKNAVDFKAANLDEFIHAGLLKDL